MKIKLTEACSQCMLVSMEQSRLISLTLSWTTHGMGSTLDRSDLAGSQRLLMAMEELTISLLQVHQPRR